MSLKLGVAHSRIRSQEVSFLEGNYLSSTTKVIGCTGLLYQEQTL